MANKIKILKITFFIAVSISILLVGVYFILKKDTESKKVIDYPEKIKIMQFDINHGLNPNKELNLKQVEELINKEKPHIVCLNNVDNGTQQTGYINQAKKLGQDLDMKYSYGKRYEKESGSTGNVILTTLPIKFAQNIFFKTGKGRQNSLLYIIQNYRGIEFHIFNLQFDEKYAREQYREAKRIVSEKDIKSGHLVITGNFAMKKTSNEIKEFSNMYTNIFDTSESQFTYSIPNPDKQYDYIFVGNNVKVLKSKVINNEMTQRISYHLPVVTTLKLK